VGVQRNFQGNNMTKAQLVGALTHWVGKIQEQVGQRIGSKALQTEGRVKQVLGRADMRQGRGRLSGG
jgi:uncharacterized protein YjbJ (UPF0337 family)